MPASRRQNWVRGSPVWTFHRSSSPSRASGEPTRMSTSSGSKGMLNRFRSATTASTGSSRRSATCSRLITSGPLTSCAVSAGRTAARDRLLDAGGQHRRHVPALGEISAPPPAGFQSPLLWGTEDYVRELFSDGFEFERHYVEFEEPSPESYADFMLTRFPPLVALRADVGEETVRDISGLGRRRE